MAHSIDKYYRKFLGKQAPVLTRLVAVNIVVFLVLGAINVIGRLSGFQTLWTHTWFSLPSNLYELLLHPWTLVTYMFTHYEVLHILFNVLWLWWFGDILLQTMSDRHLLWIYILSGLSGGVLFLLAYNLIPVFSGHSSLLNGASAGVLGVMTVAAFRSPDYHLNLLFLGALKLKWIAIGCIVLAFLGLGGGNAGGEAAHIGGVVFGCVYGISLRRGRDLLKRHKPRSKEEKKRRKAAKRIEKAASGYRSDVTRLDELLDKIRVSGFAALTSAEKRELEALSKRLNKTK